MTTTSIFWLVIVAASGGVFVLVGLLMERFSEKDWHKNLSDSRRCKSRMIWGEWIVITGIVIEIGVGIFSAIDANNNNRLNQPVVDISATVSIIVRGGNLNDELDFKKHFGGIPLAGMIYLCDSNRPPTNSWPPLSSDGFSRMYFDSKNPTSPKLDLNESDRRYGIRFQKEAAFGTFGTEAAKAKDIDGVYKVVLNCFFLPTNSVILGGDVVLIVNSDVQKVFQIPPQNKPTPIKAEAVSAPLPDIWGIVIAATDSMPAKVISNVTR